MESRSSVPADDELPPLDSTNVDLSPLIAAIRKQDYTLLESWRDQGYQYQWQDHRTHKTLLEELGALGDFASIEALGCYEESQGRELPLLDDAVLGATSNGYSPDAVTGMQCYRPSGKHSALKFSLYGAARGRHIALVNKLSANAPWEVMGVCAPYIVLGAAQAGWEAFARSVLIQYGNSLPFFLIGAVRGRHADLVEKILHDHDSGRMRFIETEAGHTPYQVAMMAAAEIGDVGLAAKILAIQAAHIASRHFVDAATDILIPHHLYVTMKVGVMCAARHGHVPLVLDLIARITLLGEHSETKVMKALASGLEESVKAQRYIMAKLFLMLGADKASVVDDHSDFYDKAPVISQMFRAFADPVLCYQIIRAYDFQGQMATQPLNLFQQAFPAFDSLSNIEIDAYFKNKELVTWLLHVDELKKIVGLPKDLLLLIGTYLTLPDKAHPVTQPLNYGSVGNILKTVEYIKKMPLKKRERVKPLPDPVVVELKQKMKQTLQRYLRGKSLYHRLEALDMLRAIEKLWSIESIYMMLTEQRALVSGTRDRDAREENTIFIRLAARPKLTGHSIFHKISLQPDYIKTLDACINHIVDAAHAPAIRKMLDDKACYQPVNRNLRLNYRMS